ncbi:2544_t:CDS:2, partial [Entrophospora sp. SA101]
RSKVLESIALCNRITKNIEGIKEDIALLKEVMEKIIDICQAHDTETGFIRYTLKHFEWGVQPINTLKEIVRDVLPVHILKEMVRFAEKVAGNLKGVRCTGNYMKKMWQKI